MRWHLADIPETIDPVAFRLYIGGHVGRRLSLTLDDLVRGFEPFEIAAVNQCSGNSRGFFSPRVAGGQWANGARRFCAGLGDKLERMKSCSSGPATEVSVIRATPSFQMAPGGIKQGSQCIPYAQSLTRADAARAAVSAFRALGGGWDLPSDPRVASDAPTGQVPPR